jgi:hypothetical protein
MYSEIVNDSGISQHTMEIIVFGAIGVFVLGLVFFLWWKQIIIGAMALAAVVVLANHRPKTPVVPKVEQEQIIIEKVIVPENPVHIELDEKKIQEGVDSQPTNKEELMTKPEDDRKYFIEDCLQFTDYNKSQCEAIWDKKDTSETKLLDVENVKYKQRRAEALKKPNAVVAHYTLR